MPRLKVGDGVKNNNNKYSVPCLLLHLYHLERKVFELALVKSNILDEYLCRC